MVTILLFLTPNSIPVPKNDTSVLPAETSRKALTMSRPILHDWTAWNRSESINFAPGKGYIVV